MSSFKKIITSIKRPRVNKVELTKDNAYHARKIANIIRKHFPRDFPQGFQRLPSMIRTDYEFYKNKYIDLMRRFNHFVHFVEQHKANNNRDSFITYYYYVKDFIDYCEHIHYENFDTPIKTEPKFFIMSNILYLAISGPLTNKIMNHVLSIYRNLLIICARCHLKCDYTITLLTPQHKPVNVPIMNFFNKYPLKSDESHHNDGISKIFNLLSSPSLPPLVLRQYMLSNKSSSGVTEIELSPELSEYVQEGLLTEPEAISYVDE